VQQVQPWIKEERAWIGVSIFLRLHPVCQCLPGPPNHVRGLLGDHENAGVHVAYGHRRHDRGVRDPERLDPVDPELGIDDGRGIVGRAHLRGADLVVHHRREVHNGAAPVIVARELVARAARDLVLVEAAPVGGEGPGLGQPDRVLHALEDDLQVGRVLEEVRLDDGRLEGIARLEAQPTDAPGILDDRPYGPGVLVLDGPEDGLVELVGDAEGLAQAHAPVRVEGAAGEEQLDVRPRVRRVLGADEGEGFRTPGDRQQALVVEGVLEEDTGPGEAALEEAHALVDHEGQPEEADVLVHVIADLGVAEDLDAEVLEVLARPDAREHEQLGRVYGARREDDLLARPDGAHPALAQVLHAVGLVVLDENLGHVGVGEDVEVRSAHPQVRLGRAAPLALVHVHLDVGKADLALAVVVEDLVAEALAGLEEGLCQLGVVRHVFHAKISVAAVVR
jgi:hypothetical protein